MLHPVAARSVERYLGIVDRLLPGFVEAFYVVGSSALGAFRPGRSDIDVVAVARGPLDDRQARGLRRAQLSSGVRTGGRALSRGLLALPGTVNATYVDRADLSLPVTSITPLAEHTGARFTRGRGGPNPVDWAVLRHHGITVRGPDPRELGLDTDPERLRAWNLDNLNTYWRRWAETVLAGGRANGRLRPARWITAWGVLGAPRLHHTILTGAVISKEAAGEYALDTFPRYWHPIVREGLAYWRGEDADPTYADRTLRLGHTASFVLAVVDDAQSF